MSQKRRGGARVGLLGHHVVDVLWAIMPAAMRVPPATTGTGWLNVCLGTRTPVEFTLACSAARCACDHVADRPQLAQQLRGA